jgi:hypothetical protein
MAYGGIDGRKKQRPIGPWCPPGRGARTLSHQQSLCNGACAYIAFPVQVRHQGV